MTKKADIKTGEDVSYKWGTGTAKGTITKVHKDDVETTIKGATVKRKASPDKPAVEIKTDKGAKVLKSTSEVKIG